MLVGLIAIVLMLLGLLGISNALDKASPRVASGPCGPCACRGERRCPAPGKYALCKQSSTVTVTYANMPGYVDDGANIVPVGPGETEPVTYQLTGGYPDGQFEYTVTVKIGEVLKGDLTGTVTDAGLRELADFQNLAWLDLRDTRVTDAGLKELAGLKKLSTLLLQDTRVTDAGIAELQKTLPKVKSGGERVIFLFRDLLRSWLDGAVWKDVEHLLLEGQVYPVNDADRLFFHLFQSPGALALMNA